jgi:glutathione S-transferase
MSKLVISNRGFALTGRPPSSKMPAFTLYGARGSTNTDRVRLTLAEGGFTDYELVLLNLQKGEQKVSEEPMTLEEDGGFSSLYEQMAIPITH